MVHNIRTKYGYCLYLVRIVGVRYMSRLSGMTNNVWNLYTVKWSTSIVICLPSLIYRRRLPNISVELTECMWMFYCGIAESLRDNPKKSQHQCSRLCSLNVGRRSDRLWWRKVRTSTCGNICERAMHFLHQRKMKVPSAHTFSHTGNKLRRSPSFRASIRF